MQDAVKELLPWVEKLGITTVLSLVGFLGAVWLVAFLVKKLVESYTDQINDLRKERDKLQNLMAEKISSGRELPNLQKQIEKKGDE